VSDVRGRTTDRTRGRSEPDGPIHAPYGPFRQLADGAATNPHGARLSYRQQQVLALIADGCTNLDIAARLGISPSTTKDHVDHLLDRLGATTRAHAVAKAFRAGVLT
jgi:DNA-binding NarL/FixJ family response regulator